MFDRVLAFLKQLPGGESEGERLPPTDDPRVAAAALMYHVMDADGVRHDDEWERMKELLSESYGVTGEALDRLVAAGGEADEDAASTPRRASNSSASCGRSSLPTANCMSSRITRCGASPSLSVSTGATASSNARRRKARCRTPPANRRKKTDHPCRGGNG